jgi:VWFA-related protein
MVFNISRMRRAALATLLVGSLAASAPAQTRDIPPPVNRDTGPQINGNESTSPASAKAASKEEAGAPMETLKVDVNLVNLVFNVRDKKGMLIPNLGKESFEVLEDGKPQAVKYFKAESNLPLTLGILIDTSLSQERVLEYEKEAGAQFLHDVISDKDLAFVINFDINVELAQDFTNSQRELGKALQSTKINAGTGGASGGPGIGQGPFPVSNPKGTLLYDAVVLAAQEKLSREVGRKAMILLTDGGDQGSFYKLEDALRSAQKSDAIVYVIFLSDSASYFGGASEMRRLADQTGGRVIDAGNRMDKLRKAFEEISQELRSQYALAYTPTNGKHDGSYRKLEIHSKEGLRVQARKGYYAPQG